MINLSAHQRQRGCGANAESAEPPGCRFFLINHSLLFFGYALFVLLASDRLFFGYVIASFRLIISTSMRAFTGCSFERKLSIASSAFA
jgi:hypothetical protein